MALLRGVLRLGIARGEFRAVLDIDDTVRCIVAPLLLAMLWRHSLGRQELAGFDPDALSQTHLQLLLDGLAVRPPVTAAQATGCQPAGDRGREKDAP